MKRLTLTGWNVWATRFVDAPTWTWEAVSGATGYRVQIAPEHDIARTFDVTEPCFEMTPAWQHLPPGPVDLLVRGIDTDGNDVCTALYKRFYKVPGYAGDVQEPLDWLGAVDRAMDYLLAPARDAVASYEEGLPRSCWSSFEDNVTGQRTHLAYPALHHPSFIFAFLLYSQQCPESAAANEARRQARVYGDWLLENRLPADWTCSLFPYSTIENGSFGGGIEGTSITLFRAARAGEAMILLHRVFGDREYLDYAHHLADCFVRLQRADGSWPYRVDPQTGEVVESYTSNAITPARLFGLLEELEPSARYAEARERAAAWVLENPVKTRLWQGMYEDVGEHEPYRNLQHWDTNEMIRYLATYQQTIPDAVESAQALNRYIEDQFVIWQREESPVTVQCPTPTALEQYLCYYPMEVHTGTWLLSLLALHQITQDETYLRKGIAAANAIVQGQQESGALSTWGNDWRFGRPLRTTDWPGCNACAVTALMRWDAYYHAGKSGERPAPSLWGI